ncbi:MAG: hypothetical protein JXR46_11095 [Calditrichaceae bacterium]|nr:hypothetical protein [Calditrichaceae bacterium]MBN2709579.1 hypothetical protein [Calditrichaceae bacterium]
MKLNTIFKLLVLTVLLTGCLTFQSLEYRIVFNDNFNGGRVTVRCEDIGSIKCSVNFSMSEKSETREISKAEIDSMKREDFAELLKMYEGDDMLLDEIKRGVYIKERRLFEDDGKLCFEYDGIFRELSLDEEEELTVLNEIITIRFELDDFTDKVETDGKLERKEKLVTITWPKTKKEIYWKIFYNQETDPDKPVYSLIDNFRSWNKEKNSH